MNLPKMPRSGVERPFWSPAEVAEYLPSETARSVSAWCRTRKIPGAKKLPNGRWLIPLAWVKDLLDDQEPNDSQAGPSPTPGPVG